MSIPQQSLNKRLDGCRDYCAGAVRKLCRDVVGVPPRFTSVSFSPEEHTHQIREGGLADEDEGEHAAGDDPGAVHLECRLPGMPMSGPVPIPDSATGGFFLDGAASATSSVGTRRLVPAPPESGAL